MLKNLVRITLRNLYKEKVHAAINIVGLAMGLACTVIVLLHAKSEYEINHNFTNVDRLFRISSQWREKGMGMYLTTLAPVGQLMQDNLPAVKHFTRLWGGYVVLNVGGNAFREDMLIADTTYFQMFGLPFLSGDPQTVFREPNSVVITEELAQKCFGSTEVLGRFITLQLFSVAAKRDFKITGVLKNLPRTSASHFGDSGNNLFVSSHNLSDFLDPSSFSSWNSRYIVTFVELHEGSQAHAVEQQLAQLMDEHCPPKIRQNVRLKLDHMARLHLTDNDGRVLKTLRSQYFFASVMLLIACINFINLSTARSLRRAKEIGVRKVLGSKRFDLIKQFLLETMLLAFLALVIAAGLMELFNAFLRPALGNMPAVRITAEWQSFGIILAVTICTGLLAGLYPAVFLSSLRPASVLQAGKGSGKSAGWIRQALVVLQFAAAIFLLIASGVVSKQLDFFMNRDLGFKDENILVIESMPREWNFPGIQKQEGFRDRLRQLPAVNSAALCWDVPGSFGSGALELTSTALTEGQKVTVTQFTVDERYLETLGVPLLAGRFFAKEYFHADSSTSIVLNEAAAQALALTQPVGEKVRAAGGQTLTVVGVVKNFQFSMFERADRPVAFVNVYNAGIYRFMAVNINAPHLLQTVDQIETFWKSNYPDVPFIFRFLDDVVQEQYAGLIRMRHLSRFSTALALFVACMGLLGLASYAAQQRRKEIGIRKVLGATVAGITGLLSRDFVRLILLANLIAAPLAWYVMQHWLQDFAERVEIGGMIFIISGGLALLIGLLTVCTQAIKAALANPAEALRHE